jgi:hypothetical protein
LATLGEVLGGVLVDAIRSRVTADSMSRELVAEYRQDPVLSLFSVPRLAVREMQVTLRFVVQSFEPGSVSEEAVADAWSAVLSERIVPQLLRERGAGLSADELGAMRSTLEEQPLRVSERAVASALEADTRPLIDESVEAVLNRLREVPQRLRRRVGTLTELRNVVRRQVLAELHGFLESQQELANVRGVLDSRLDVGVVRTDLESAPATAIQEVTVKLTMEDIETLVGGAELVREVGPS